MADTAPETAPVQAAPAENGKGGEKRRGGKGRGKGGFEGGKSEGRPEGGKGTEGGKGKGSRPRKVRPEIPTFDDPQAELDKMDKAPTQPNRDNLEVKIKSIQTEIDTSKMRTEAITADLDAIKEKNDRLKQSGSGPMEKCREAVRELKKQIVGVIEERKAISSQINTMQEKKKSGEEAIKKQKAAVGRFSTNDAIDEEINRIEDFMAHNSIDLKTEKDYMLQIKELNKKRDDVKTLEQMEGKRGVGGASAMSLPDLFEARKGVDARLDELREQEKVAVAAQTAQRDKSQSKDSDRFEKLLEERKAIRDKISEKISAIRTMRNEFQEADDKWYEHERLAKNLKWQMRMKQKAEQEEKQKEWEERKVTDQAAWEADKEHKKNFDEDGNPREKVIDWELAEKIILCEQLIMYCSKYAGSSESKTSPAVVAPTDGRRVEKPSDVVAFDRDRAMVKGLGEDSLGLNAFMVDEVVSKRSKKKDKKKKANAEKTDETTMLAAGDVIQLQLTLEMLQDFANMGLAVPVDSSDCAGSIVGLKEKKAYYEQKADEGLKLKDVLKQERDAKRGVKSKKTDDVAKELKTEDCVGSIVEKGDEGLKPNYEVEEEVAEEVEEEVEEPKDQSSVEVETATVAATKDVDWNADKIARKLASMPDIDPTLDIAAMRAKAQGAKMSEEEKKERGLLYDTSKASALRESDSEDDEGAADFEGGFDWD